MSRKPVHLEMVGGKGNRQRIWEAIREHGRSGSAFTLAELSRSTKVEIPTVREYCAGLTAAGFITQTVEPGKAALFAMARDNGAEAPRVRKDGTLVTAGLKQEQMWRTLRLLGGADTNYVELAAHASTPSSIVSQRVAKDYLADLHGAKYLECTTTGRGYGKGGKPHRYRLITYTGPKPPMVTSLHGIYDPNLNALVWVQPVNEETVIYGK